MERQGIGRPSTYAPTIQTLKQRDYVELIKGCLHPTALGLEVDRFLSDALPDLLQSEFTAQMEQALDAIADGKQDWEHYVTCWNHDYFEPALLRAQRVIPQHLTTTPAVRSGNFSSHFANQPTEKSRTKCPTCQKPLAKIPSKKVKKKYFLKCVEGCPDTVLFWSDYTKKWEAPKAKTEILETSLSTVSSSKTTPAKTKSSKTKSTTTAKKSSVPKSTNAQTTHSCPVCRKSMEEYHYEKDGQQKKLLRCSDAEARRNPKHKEAVYFHTQNGWWSPKFGELPTS